MAQPQKDAGAKISAKDNPETRGLSLDGWAVAIALLLTALVRLGVLKHVAW